MNPESIPPSGYPPLPRETVVLRAMLRRRWIDQRNQIVLPQAFVRRDAPADPDGLSVGVFCDVDDYLKGFRETFGTATLLVGHVRDEGLDIVQDEPTHACIKGLPYPKDDPDGAQRLANALARKACLLPRSTEAAT